MTTTANLSATNLHDCREEADVNKKITILYERLSHEDSRADESLSIENQKKILENYAVQNGFTPFIHLSDDGRTGVDFNRPGWQELIARVENDEVSTVILKKRRSHGSELSASGAVPRNAPRTRRQANCHWQGN
jgi:predicted site-specific integrase-resolvase